MLILSQTKDMRGYHGTVGTPTNMYDYRGEQLFVGDVVCLVTFGVDGKKAYDFGIEFVCEENTSIANWTGKNHQYVMGIASTYNNEKELQNHKEYISNVAHNLYTLSYQLLSLCVSLFSTAFLG